MIDSNILKSIALKNGADAVGICDVEKFTRLKKYLSEKESTRFEEKDIDKKIDPLIHFNDAKSALVILKSYKLYKNTIKKDELKVASASLTDYHKELRLILDKIKEQLLEYNINSKNMCDFEGLIDREVAFKAGVGFYGKNAFIINEDIGSSFNIGYLLVDCELKVDSILKIDCGDCDICVKACPKGAINGDYTINSTKCLSYITQDKEAVKQKLHGYMYGCDICQRVCPYNTVYDRNEDYIFKIDDIIGSSNKQLKLKYKDRDFIWVGPKRLKRNAMWIKEQR